MVLIVAAILLGVRSADSKYIKILRYKVWDAYQTIYPRQDVSDYVSIVNITESDIKKYGQWPWPRHMLAMLTAKVSDSGSALINMNILFSEPDRMGGVEYLKSMPMTNDLRETLGQTLLDTDGVFGLMIKEANVILMQSVKTVSYTHLTLPTKRIV